MSKHFPAAIAIILMMIIGGTIISFSFAAHRHATLNIPRYYQLSDRVPIDIGRAPITH